MPSRPALYLAGPDVFRPDAAQWYDRSEGLCERCGLHGLRPSDGGLADGFDGPAAELAQRIYDGNLALIRRCDAVIANLAPFRGHVEPDSGTVFEVGMAIALGKPVAAYLPEHDRSYAERVARHFPTRRDAAGTLWDDTHGCWIEGFGEPLNLMLSRSTALFGSFEDALAHLAAVLRPRDRAATLRDADVAPRPPVL